MTPIMMAAKMITTAATTIIVSVLVNPSQTHQHPWNVEIQTTHSAARQNNSTSHKQQAMTDISQYLNKDRN
jgi:hypothetical protein